MPSETAQPIIRFWKRKAVRRASNCLATRKSIVLSWILDLSGSSGFQFLLDLVPNRNRPEIAVLIFTRLQRPHLANMSLENGAQAYLVKQQTSADALDKAVKKAVTAVASALGKRTKVCSSNLFPESL